MDDIWNDITTTTTTLSSPTTTHFFPPLHRPPETTTTTTTTTTIATLPPPPSTTTMLTLLTPTNSGDQDPYKRLKTTPPPVSFPAPAPEYSEKFRRLMKNRESAARSRARKQARANQLEHEVMRLAKENAKLKRLQKEAHMSHVPKESKHQRSKSAPF